jgi:hypothetical protein
MASRTRLGVIGVSFTSAPIDASASRTAFAIAAGDAMAQRDAHLFGVGEGWAVRTSYSEVRSNHRHANSLRIAASLRADMIFGKHRSARQGLPGADRGICFNDHIEYDGPTVFRRACKMGPEPQDQEHHSDVPPARSEVHDLTYRFPAS